MDDLLDALGALAGEDLAPLFGPTLLDRLRPLLVAQNRLAAEIARTVRACEVTGAAEHDGLKTMASWLRGHAHLSAAEAARLVRTGRSAEHLPAVAAAHAAGAVTGEQAALIARVVDPFPLTLAADQGVDPAAVADTLVEVAVTRPHADLRTAVHHYLDRLDPDGPEPDPTDTRSLTVTRHPDGSVTGRFHLDPAGAEKLAVTLESIAAAGRCAGDTRSRTRQQADALVQLCDLALASGTLPVLRSVKPHLVIRIDAADLTDRSAAPGTADTGSGATVPAATARAAACDAQLTRLVLDPDGMPLDVGRTRRTVPAHIRRAAEQRDGGCVFTGCGAPTWWCDVHHQVEWIDGGETSLDNSALLCERHHTKVHHGFRVERAPDGRWRTWRPDGTEIVTGPRLTAV